MIKVKGFEYRKTVYGYENAMKEGFAIGRSENRMVTVYSGKKCKEGFSYLIFVNMNLGGGKLN